MKSKHVPVMKKEVIELLNIKSNGLYVDMTFGSGGHSKAILDKLDHDGKLVSFDIFEHSIAIAKKLELVHSNFTFYPTSYVDFYKYLNKNECNGMVMDIGFSSVNLNCKRGFSYKDSDENIDMRYSLKNSKTAANILNTLSFNSLKNEFKKYDVKNIHKFVSNIIEWRKKRKLKTVKELNRIIVDTYGEQASFKMKMLIFQALRIMVNDEINNLKQVLKTFQHYLATNGRLAIICFNSLERSIILKHFRDLVKLLPSKLPTLNEPKFELVTKHPLSPTMEEMESNSRAQSAKLIVIRRK